MATTPVQRKVTPVDPMFAIPAGSDELVYGTNSGIEAIGSTGPVDSYTGQPVDLSNVSIPIGGTPAATVPTPDIIGIVSQQVRRSPSGDNVIDVVLEVSDVLGATKYEFRVTKV